MIRVLSGVFTSPQNKVLGLAPKPMISPLNGGASSTQKLGSNITRKNSIGTDGRNRTDTPKERDFESRASTSSATPAYQEMRPYKTEYFKKPQLIL